MAGAHVLQTAITPMPIQHRPPHRYSGAHCEIADKCQLAGTYTIISGSEQLMCTATHTFAQGPNWPAGSTDQQSRDACAAECTKRAACTHFTWFSDRGCQTFNSCENTKNAQAAAGISAKGQSGVVLRPQPRRGRAGVVALYWEWGSEVGGRAGPPGHRASLCHRVPNPSSHFHPAACSRHRLQKARAADGDNGELRLQV